MTQQRKIDYSRTPCKTRGGREVTGIHSRDDEVYPWAGKIDDEIDTWTADGVFNPVNPGGFLDLIPCGPIVYVDDQPDPLVVVQQQAIAELKRQLEVQAAIASALEQERQKFGTEYTDELREVADDKWDEVFLIPSNSPREAMHAAVAAVLERVATSDADLRDLVKHAWVHSNYANCGYRQMTTEQKRLFDSITDCDNLTVFERVARSKAERLVVAEAEAVLFPRYQDDVDKASRLHELQESLQDFATRPTLAPAGAVYPAKAPPEMVRALLDFPANGGAWSYERVVEEILVATQPDDRDARIAELEQRVLAKIAESKAP